jgi:hypothetical protein
MCVRGPPGASGSEVPSSTAKQAVECGEDFPLCRGGTPGPAMAER